MKPEFLTQPAGGPAQGRVVLWARDLCVRWGVSLSTLWRWRRAGSMPEPDFQKTGWRLETIENFERGAAALPPHPRPAPAARPRARHK